MFSVFETYLRTHAGFLPGDMEAIKSVSIVKTIKKRKKLLSPGDISRYYTFVCSGCLRTYRIDAQGIEYILEFTAANQWATEDRSWVPFMPFTAFVEAVEDTIIIQIPGEDYKRLTRNIAAFEMMHQRVCMEKSERGAERLYSMFTTDASKRYKEFKMRYPDLYPHVPAYMIASYLGVARETLSRIRANEKEDTSNITINHNSLTNKHL